MLQISSCLQKLSLLCMDFETESEKGAARVQKKEMAKGMFLMLQFHELVLQSWIQNVADLRRSTASERCLSWPNRILAAIWNVISALE